MAEGFLVAAWAAGIVEGGSVLKQATKDESFASLLLPSVVYGTVALPMSVIGESPGPALLAMFHSQVVLPRDTPAPTPSRDERPIDNSIPMIQRVRQENRSKHQPAIQTGSSKSSKVSNPNRYFATLDGRQALATPLAESMRRLRLVFFGAGLVGLYFQRQSRPNNTEVTTISDAVYMEQLVSQANRSNPNGGVILRLVDRPISTVPPGRLPIVYPRPLESLERLPLDDNWFLRIDNDSHKFLVTESNRCPPLSQCFGTQNSVFTKYSTQLDFALHRLARVAHRNDATLIQVCIGSGPSADTPNNTIYLDGLQAVAEKLVQSIEKAHAAYFLQRQQLSTTNPENKGDDLPSSPAADSDKKQVVPQSEQASESESHSMDIFERLGLKIRQGIQIPTNVLASAVKRWDRGGGKPVLYIVSDHADFWNWLGILLVGYRLEWLDPEQSETYPKTGGVFLVFCSSDEKTSQVVTSIMEEATDDRHAVALMDKEWVQNVTLEMIQDGPSSANSNNVQIQCAETIHRDLFDHVQKLLTSGWTPERIQKSAAVDPKSPVQKWRRTQSRPMPKMEARDTEHPP
jgi:hypothetical protein